MDAAGKAMGRRQGGAARTALTSGVPSAVAACLGCVTGLLAQGTFMPCLVASEPGALPPDGALGLRGHLEGAHTDVKSRRGRARGKEAGKRRGSA